MKRDAILDTLKTTPEKEPPQTTALRHQAHSIISATDPHAIEQLPSTLLDLLTQIIRPLFIKTKHPNLTSTGRKSLIDTPPPPSSARAFLDLDDDPPWKTPTPFTIPLLEYILASYSALPCNPPDITLRKTTIEAHFHLLVPPILNMIDDAAPTPYKSAGCRSLALLCEVLTSTQSEMLKRSGLADVFVDALKANFLLLPTLTPEADSLALLREVYAAFLGVVDARFVKLRLKLGVPSIQTAGSDALDEAEHADDDDKDFIPYQAMLTLVYRHGVMASLAHLGSAGSGAGSLSNTMSVPLTVFLLLQIPPVFARMGIHAVKHFQGLLPMLRASLMDPFVLLAPEMVGAILDVVDCVLEVGRPRVQQKWWPEVLRGLVGCWVNCVDEIENADEKKSKPKSKATKPGNSTPTPTPTPVEEIMARLQRSVKTLGEIVGPDEWSVVKKRLVEEEDDVKALFGN
jgi:hypothetical protein